MKRTEGIGVTIYALFGEEGAAEDPEFIHIEDIVSRSSLYEWHISTHAHHRMFQVVYIVSGGVVVDMEGKASTLKGPCAITVPPGAVHSFAFQPDTVGYVLTSADTLLLDARYMPSRPLIDPLLSEPQTIDFSASPETATFVQNLLDAIMREFAQAMPGRSSMLDWLLHSVVLALARQAAMDQPAPGRRGYSRETFSSFLKLVEDNYRKHLNVGDYARKLAMSPARLNRLCRTFADRPAQEILHARLALEAQRLLTYTAATSAQIAYELGFQDPAYFTRFFRRQTGETPNAFRQTE